MFGCQHKAFSSPRYKRQFILFLVFSAKRIFIVPAPVAPLLSSKMQFTAFSGVQSAAVDRSWVLGRVTPPPPELFTGLQSRLPESDVVYRYWSFKMRCSQRIPNILKKPFFVAIKCSAKQFPTPNICSAYPPDNQGKKIHITFFF